MEPEGFDVYPILHKGRIYNILTPLDMTFREVRAMIDWLDARGAFPAGVGAKGEAANPLEPQEPLVPLEPGELHSCPVEGVVFDVDVQGFEIVVYRREPPG